MSKKLFSILLAFSIVLSSLSVILSFNTVAAVSIWDGTTASAYAGGDGSQNNPYQISNGAELSRILEDVQKEYYYVITSDIYLNDVSKSNWKDNSPNSWRYVENYFRGTIDGADHTIYGLYYNGNKKIFGLVNRIDGETAFKNLRISDAYIKTTGGTTNDDTLIGTAVFAGFVKSGGSFTAENCYVSESVSISGVKGVGTFCGYGNLNNGFSLENCATFAQISASKYGGAFAGGCWGSNHSYTNCIAGTGRTLNNKLNATVTDCYTTSESEAYTFSGLTKITDSQMKGTAAKTNMPNLDWTNVWQTTDGYPVLIKKTPQVVEPIEGLGESWEDFAADSYAGGDGTKANPYKISNAEQFAHLIKDSATSGKYYVITKDIQLNKTSKDGFASKRNWFDSNQNSYYFQGNLDGKNHIISGLYYYNGNVTSNTFAALIPRTTAGANINNIILKNSSITMISSLKTSGDFSAVAGIVGHANGNTHINNCYVESTVYISNINSSVATNKNARVGGIIGAGNKSIWINSCAFLGSLTYPDGGRYGSMFGDVWSSASSYTKEIKKSIAVKYNPSSNYAFTGSDNIFEVKSDKTSKGTAYTVSPVDCKNIDKTAFKKINSSFYLTESGYPKPCGIGNRFCDVNGDLKATADDLTAMVNLILEKDTIGCVNINGDDSSNILDLVYLKKTLATNIAIRDNYNNVPEDMKLSEETDVTIGFKSVTITMYDVANNTYGITCNSTDAPVKPVIQVCESPMFDSSNVTEYAASATKYSSYSDTSTTFDYFVTKGIVSLKPDTDYTYRVLDKSTNTASKTGSIRTQSHNATSFTFMHFSDSQVGGSSETNPGTSGSHFQKTLAAAYKNTPNMAFALHTGDIVEWSKYEAYWENMLDKYCSDYFMSIPFMAISGNHETTYRNGSNETFKHFNLNLPTQDTTKGVYYSYDYGNVRFIMVNTNRVKSDKTLTDDQYNWLVSVLKNKPSNIKWTIVSMHCPMYSVGKYGSNSSNNAASVALKNQLSKLFADNNVDLVLEGHDHEYSKTKPIISPDTVDTSYTTQTINGVKYDVNPKGTVYAMNGPAGSQTRAPESSINASLYDYYNTENTKQHSFAKISVDGDKLTVEIMYESGGNAVAVYSYGIIKN